MLLFAANAAEPASAAKSSKSAKSAKASKGAKKPQIIKEQLWLNTAIEEFSREPSSMEAAFSQMQAARIIALKKTAQAMKQNKLLKLTDDALLASQQYLDMARIAHEMDPDSEAYLLHLNDAAILIAGTANIAKRSKSDADPQDAALYAQLLARFFEQRFAGSPEALPRLSASAILVTISKLPSKDSKIADLESFLRSAKEARALALQLSDKDPTNVFKARHLKIARAFAAGARARLHELTNDEELAKWANVEKSAYLNLAHLAPADKAEPLGKIEAAIKKAANADEAALELKDLEGFSLFVPAIEKMLNAQVNIVPNYSQPQEQEQ